MELFLVIFLVLSLAGNGFLVWGILRALRHKEQYDDFFEELQSRLGKIIQAMKSIDIRGSFEADDEVGDVFKQLQALVESLDVFLISESSNENQTAEK